MTSEFLVPSHGYGQIVPQQCKRASALDPEQSFVTLRLRCVNSTFKELSRPSCFRWQRSRAQCIVQTSTKHPKSGTEVRAALPSLGMYEEKEEGEMLSEAPRINVKVGKVGTNKWKPPIPARPDETNLRGVVAGISAQESNPSSVDAGKTAQVSRHTTYRVGTTVRSVFAASQLLGTAASQQDILRQITSEWITAMIFLVLSMFALLGIYITIREWIGLILELWHDRCSVRRGKEELQVQNVCDLCSRMREETPREEVCPTLRRRREDYRHQELGEVSDRELWMELHHHDYTRPIHPTVPIGSPKERVRARPYSEGQVKAQGKTFSEGCKQRAGGTAQHRQRAAPRKRVAPPRPLLGKNLSRRKQIIRSEIRSQIMTAEELADFQRAKERYFGVDRLGEESEQESGRS